jgi:predicted kinase
MKLYIIRGLPGSGKSTYAKKLGCFHVEADFYHCRDGVYKYNRDNIKAAHEWCQKMALTAMSIGMDVVVSNTFTMKSEMQPYIDMAKKTGHAITIVRMIGSHGSIHDVPDDSMKKMRDRWEIVEGEIISL